MKIYGINNAIPTKGTDKVLRTMERNGVRRFATIEDLFVKDKPAEFLPEEKEQEILDYMHRLEEQRAVEAFKAIQTAKKIILNV